MSSSGIALHIHGCKAIYTGAVIGVFAACGWRAMCFLSIGEIDHREREEERLANLCRRSPLEAHGMIDLFTERWG